MGRGENGESAGPQCPVDPAQARWGVCSPQCLLQSTLSSRTWLVSRPAAGPGPGLVRMYSQEVRPRCAGARLAGNWERHCFHWGWWPTPSLGGPTRCAGKGLLIAIAALQVFALLPWWSRAKMGGVARDKVQKVLPGLTILSWKARPGSLEPLPQTPSLLFYNFPSPRGLGCL